MGLHGIALGLQFLARVLACLFSCSLFFLQCIALHCVTLVLQFDVFVALVLQFPVRLPFGWPACLQSLCAEYLLSLVRLCILW